MIHSFTDYKKAKDNIEKATAIRDSLFDSILSLEQHRNEVIIDSLLEMLYTAYTLYDVASEQYQEIVSAKGIVNEQGTSITASEHTDSESFE